jgi:predicted Ser/Thr protein kinase
MVSAISIERSKTYKAFFETTIKRLPQPIDYNSIDHPTELESGSALPDIIILGPSLSREPAAGSWLEELEQHKDRIAIIEILPPGRQSGHGRECSDDLIWYTVTLDSEEIATALRSACRYITMPTPEPQDYVLDDIWTEMTIADRNYEHTIEKTQIISHSETTRILSSTSNEKTFSPVNNDLPGTKPIYQLDGYDIEKDLARGGMAAVYLGTDRKTRRKVVIKIIDHDVVTPEDQSDLKRFVQEYTVISRIDSPNVVKIYERGFTKDYSFIVMEYFSGGDLSGKVRQGLTPAQALNYISQIANGLKHIHDIGIIHRDLKLGNILFRDDDTCAITDFGIAKILGGSGNITMTQSILGTPVYMSPEQCKGEPCDPRSDLYSLGVIFYMLLTGSRPYPAKSINALMEAHISEPPPRLDDELARYQPLVDSLMAKSPGERYQNVGDFIASLKFAAIMSNQ